MAINDDDKKFIKDTIENAIEKRMDTFEKTNDMKQKSQQLKWEETRKKDRDAYLAELQQRDKRGEATIAQKMEMLKLSVDKAIPEDLKNAAKSGGKTIANGANQMGAGLGHLNARLMMSNPLTAMLYQNRDIFSAIGDVGIGAAKVGWGATKGLAQGVAGLFNTAVNSFKKTKDEESVEEEQTSFFSPKPAKESKGLVEDILESKQDWQKQIDDIHKNITKQGKDEKKSNEFLAKGLAGLGETMTAIKAVTDVVQAKQKLIVLGVLAGVAAIAALAAWFQSGNLANLIKNALDNTLGKKVDQNVQNSQTKIDNSINVANFGSLSGQTSIQTANQGLQQDNTTKYQNGANFNFDDVVNPARSGKFAEKQNLTDATMDLLKWSTYVNAGFNKTIKNYKNDKGDIKIAFPVKVKMLDVRFSKNENTGASILIEKSEVTAGKKEAARFASGSMPRIIITNVTKLLIPKKVVIPANTTLCHVGADYQILGDVSAFMRGQKFEEYTNKNMKDYKKIDDNYIKLREDKKFNQKLIDSEKDYLNATSLEAGAAQTVKDAYDHITGGDIDKDNKKQEDKKETPPNVTTTTVNDNASKAKQQNEQLQKKPEQKQTSTQQPAQTSNQGKQNTITTKTSKSQSTQFADTNLSQAQYGAMTANGTNLGVPN